MKKILERLYQHKTLTKAESKSVLIKIANDEYDSHQIASFLTAFIMRNITLEELTGFRDGLVELRKPVDLDEYKPMDLCGTGGDGKNTFNISTLTSFVVAGAGIPVAKHGNYGVSSVSGSSNVLQQLGVTFQSEENKIKKQLDSAGICFLHAPLFHPAMKAVGPIRRALKVKTFFNMLGPLVNPCQPKIQMVGVFNLELARLYQYIFQQEEKQYSIVFSTDGYDEISLTCPCKIITQDSENLLNPEDMGFNRITPVELFGGNTIEEAADIFMKIISGKGNQAQNDIVTANSIQVIQTYYPKISREEAKIKAESSLFDLKALKALDKLKTIL